MKILICAPISIVAYIDVAVLDDDGIGLHVAFIFLLPA
uniref:Uncharacterized protein n=1 Tax=Rhizophora mucronata TaxID=61149 RepID=A0A2P2KNL9_RHIMU